MVATAQFVTQNISNIAFLTDSSEKYIYVGPGSVAGATALVFKKDDFTIFVVYNNEHVDTYNGYVAYEHNDQISALILDLTELGSYELNQWASTVSDNPAGSELTIVAGSEYSFTSTISLGSVGGDPYLFPMNSQRAIKLPNCDSIYRLLQIPSMDTIVNVSVTRASPSQRKEIQEQAAKHTHGDDLHVVDDGCFMDKLYVQYRGIKRTIDLKTDDSCLMDETIEWTGPIQRGVSQVGMLQGDYTYRQARIGCVTFEVRIYKNRQIRNEVSFGIQSNVPLDASGLLCRNYRPVLFQLNRLHDGKICKRHLTSKRPTTCKDPVNQWEVRDSVMYPQFFSQSGTNASS